MKIFSFCLIWLQPAQGAEGRSEEVHGFVFLSKEWPKEPGCREEGGCRRAVPRGGGGGRAPGEWGRLKVRTGAVPAEQPGPQDTLMGTEILCWLCWGAVHPRAKEGCFLEAGDILSGKKADVI